MKLTALQIKTSYSILNSLNDIKKLVLRAANYGYDALAITDLNNMFGVMEFHEECKKNNIKPIIGIELTIDDSEILLYAKNNEGYKNLIKLSTIVSERNLTIEDLKEYQDNLILVMPFLYYNKEIYKIYKDKYVGYTSKEEKDKIKDKCVFINNVSYLDKEDSVYLDYAKMIKEGKIVGEYEINETNDNYLYTKEELLKLVSSDTLETMSEIVDNCNVELTYKEGLLPIYDKDIDSKDYLRKMSLKV